MRYIKQIWTALYSDDSGNHHTLGAFHTGPSITPRPWPRGDSKAGMKSTEGVMISSIVRIQSSPYLFYIPHR